MVLTLRVARENDLSKLAPYLQRSCIKMTNYLHFLGITAWRKKSTFLVAAALLSLIIFGLQYTKFDNKHFFKVDNESPNLIAKALEGANVKFLHAKEKNPDVSTVRNAAATLNIEMSKLEQPSRDDIASRILSEKQAIDSLETEQQLGIPYVNLDPVHPYVPKRRIVHFDLKGAPPVISFFKRIFPLLKTMGATGILLEYEDMFPFTGILKSIAAKNAYSAEQIKEILQLAEASKLEVIPLIQTFGHVEFALKHEEWSGIRETIGSPQALCPSRNSSLNFIKELVNQVMSLHPNIKFLHIGCDEVFQMGECEICRLELPDTLFLRHIRRVANIVHQSHPHLRIIIWDDMLRHLSQQSMIEVNLGDFVEPMVWVYAEDIYRFVQPPVWDKYASVFKTAWAASAFKGAFGETLYIPDARRHLENNLRWLDVMSQQSRAFKQGLMGITITGWQRYDHFAVLCELFPAAIPSLALSIISVSHGYFSSALKNKFLSALSCPQQASGRASPFINLDSDPHLWDKLNRCMFPGSSFFRLTYRLHSAESEAVDFIKMIKEQKGWMTDYNVRHNYSLPLRVDELTGDLPRIYHGMLSLTRTAVDTMLDMFDNATISEWIEQRIYPYIIELEKIQNQSIALKSVNHWPSRPLHPLNDLQRLGIPIS